MSAAYDGEQIAEIIAETRSLLDGDGISSKYLIRAARTLIDIVECLQRAALESAD